MPAELLARKVFADRPWIVPIQKSGSDWLEMEKLMPTHRLDVVLPSLGQWEREVVARQALVIALDLFLAGYAHRDFHAKNLFWDGSQLQLVDFETLVAYPEGQLPAFRDSYDLKANGLESPFETSHMCFLAERPEALGQLLGIDEERALKIAESILKDRIRDASATFKTTSSRHRCRAQRIYSSFNLPNFSVTVAEAQRNSARRLERFGITQGMVRDKSVLDIGCNVGAILFELQRLSPKRCLGLEYDSAKVDVARSIAAFAGVSHVDFIEADIDTIDPASVGRFDNVFCLALVEHVQRKTHLYEVLGHVTAGRLFFEGNSSTSVEEVEKQLKRVGFTTVEYLGKSDDDCRPENNCRPLLRASKGFMDAGRVDV